MSIWQLASVRRYLHCLKVDGDGEENQCGCKQRNGRVMCSPGQAMQKKPCQGNTERRLNSLVFLPALPTATFNPHTHLSSWSQSSRLSFPAASRNANSAEPANQSAGWNGKQECKWARLDSHMQRGDVLDGDWWCLFLFILFITKHTHTHIHSKSTGCMQTWPAFIWAVVDQSGKHGWPWSLASLLLLDHSTCPSGLNQYCLLELPTA